MALGKVSRKLLKALRLLNAKLWMAAAAVALKMTYPQHAVALKRSLVRRYVAHVGDGTSFSPNLLVFWGFNTRIGKDCSLGFNFQIFDFAEVSIGDNLLASHNITLVAGTHTQDASRTYIPGPISIGNNVWMGANVVIVGPCSIGDDCVIGANSFVKGQVPAGSTIGGSPARIIR